MNRMSGATERLGAMTAIEHAAAVAAEGQQFRADLAKYGGEAACCTDLDAAPCDDLGRRAVPVHLPDGRTAVAGVVCYFAVRVGRDDAHEGWPARDFGACPRGRALRAEHERERTTAFGRWCERAGLPDRFRTVTFDSIRRTRAVGAADAYARGPMLTGRALALTGNRGCGKTFAAVAVLRAAWERRWAVQFVKCTRFAELLRDDDAVRAAERCGLLVLDDVGKERATRGQKGDEWLGAGLFGLLEVRHDGRRATVLTAESNDALFRQHPDLQGRLTAWCVGGADDVSGDDLRTDNP